MLLANLAKIGGDPNGVFVNAVSQALHSSKGSQFGGGGDGGRGLQSGKKVIGRPDPIQENPFKKQVKKQEPKKDENKDNKEKSDKKGTGDLMATWGPVTQSRQNEESEFNDLTNLKKDTR